jgi:hypothetical protein
MLRRYKQGKSREVNQWKANVAEAREQFGNPEKGLSLEDVTRRLVKTVAVCNSDLYSVVKCCVLK